MADPDTKMTEADSKGEMEEEVSAQQIRVSFRLAPEYASQQQDEENSLEVPTEAIAVPGHLTRKALSTVVNHLLGRGDDDDEEEDADNSSKLPVLDFEFLVGESSNNRRLLRTSLDKHIRTSGLSLEQAVLVTYFPSTPAPQETPKDGPPMPDWISGLSHVGSFVVSACYDGSLHVLQQQQNSVLVPLTSKLHAHAGPIKCLDTQTQGTGDDAPLWMATGSMDNTVALHSFVDGEIACRATAQHASSVASVKFGSSSSNSVLRLASGDWDGGVFVWRYNPNDKDAQAMEVDGPSSKKRKGATVKETKPQRLVPTISLQAHNSKVSGLSFGGADGDDSLITSSWDHAIKVWNLEREDCLLTVNTSRVVSCLDTSPHSRGICVTGHPDCFLRLWDVRVSSQDSKPSSLFESQNTFKPSHKAWISQVAWSKTNPYQVYSASHDGTVKVWDLRSSMPLHTVKVCNSGNNQEEKILSLALASDFMFVGGTTKIVEQYQMPSAVAK